MCFTGFPEEQIVDLRKGLRAGLKLNTPLINCDSGRLGLFLKAVAVTELVLILSEETDTDPAPPPRPGATKRQDGNSHFIRGLQRRG